MIQLTYQSLRRLLIGASVYALMTPLLWGQQACDFLGPNFSVAAASGTYSSASGTLQSYVLVDGSGNIVQVSSTGAFTGIDPANYTIYAVSHDNSVTNLSAPNPVSSLGGCFLLSAPYNVKVCNVVNKDMNVCLGNPLIAQSQPGTWSLQGSDFIQTYVLVNAAGQIVDIQNSGVFPSPPAGNYTIRAVNYRGPSLPAGLSVGSSYASFNPAASCAVASAPAPAQVVPPATIANDMYSGPTGFQDACTNAQPAGGPTSSGHADNTCALPVGGALGTEITNGRMGNPLEAQAGNLATTASVTCGSVELDLNDNPLFYAITVPPGASMVEFDIDHATVGGDIVRIEGAMYGPLDGTCGFPSTSGSWVDCDQNNSPTSSDFTLSSPANPGEVYIVVIDAIGEGPFDFNTTTLPVEYLSFDGFPESDHNQLKWVTATEINSHYFDVQRSENGVSFSSIGRVDAAGNSSTPQTYGLKDYNILPILYYRLEQFDLDGASHLSDMVQVIRPTQDYMVSIFPNPAQNSLNIRLDGVVESTTFTLYNADGQLVLKEEWNPDGTFFTTLDISSLSSGVYFYQVNIGGNRSNGKLVKSN